MEVKTERNLWIDYLRSAITVLVVAHHAALAYTTFASFNKDAYILSTHPVVDLKRLFGLDTFVAFNNQFFMSLMFFIGGLFVFGSIAKKGSLAFVRDRIFRLFVPFILGGTLLMLIAYLPAFYLAKNSWDLKNYIVDFFTTESWPVGPPWFIWLLFLFNLLFAVFYALGRKFLNFNGMIVQKSHYSSSTIMLVLFSVTWVLYVPIVAAIGPYAWTGLGPFDFQLSRILLYAGYFVLGVFVAPGGFNESMFDPKSILVKKWWLWGSLSIVIFLLMNFFSPWLMTVLGITQPGGPAYFFSYQSIYVITSSLSCVAFATTFRRFAVHSNRLWDSLSENAYLIYLLHYPFTIWMQFLLMDTSLAAVAKFLMTFICSLGLSWTSAKGLRKIALVRKYL